MDSIHDSGSTKSPIREMRQVTALHITEPSSIIELKSFNEIFPPLSYPRDADGGIRRNSFVAVANRHPILAAEDRYG